MSLLGVAYTLIADTVSVREVEARDSMASGVLYHTVRGGTALVNRGRDEPGEPLLEDVHMPSPLCSCKLLGSDCVLTTCRPG